MTVFPRRQLFAIGILLSCATAADAEQSAGSDPGRYADGLRKWTTADSIGVGYFMQFMKDGSRVGAFPGVAIEPNPEFTPYVAAPDGRHFFCVSFRGELATDSTVYELQVFSAAAVARHLAGQRSGAAPMPEPLRRIVFKSPAEFHISDMDSEVISRPYWESSSAIVFFGIEGKGSHRLYRLNVESGALTALTPPEYDVMVPLFGDGYAVRGNSVFFTVNERYDWKPLDRYPLAVVEGNELMQMALPVRARMHYYVSHDGKTARRLGTSGYGGAIEGPWLSPDGKRAIGAYVPENAPVPDAWNEYESKPRVTHRFMLMDLEKGTSQDLLDAPAGSVTQAGSRARFKAFWTADSRHVLIYNTALPLTENKSERRRMAYLVDVDVTTRALSVVAPLTSASGDRMREAKLLAEGRSVLVRYYAPGQDTPKSGTVYSFDGAKWKGRTVAGVFDVPERNATHLSGGLSVSLAQSPNDPQVLMAFSGKRSVALAHPAPPPEDVWRATAEAIEWQEDKGATVKGSLMLPRDYSKSTPVPLIIQGTDGGYEKNMFQPDGGESGYAAQALVASGMAVLQAPMCYYDRGTTMRTPGEGPAKVMRVDAMVNALAGRGIADPARIGLVGFSRCGYTAYYVITHPGKTRLGAVTIIDALTASYGEYVNEFGGGSTGAAIYEEQYGKGSFWENKTAWLDAPAFNVEKVTTPALFTSSNNPVSALETVGVFRYTKRPFDFLFFQKAGHVYQRPRERAAAMQATVDWMRFWLQEQAPAASADDPGRPQRWAKIKADWLARQP